MTRVFIFGTLLHAPLRAAVAGSELPTRPARLVGHTVHWAADESYPVLVPGAGVAEGAVLDVGGAALDRLNFYEAAFDYHPTQVTVETDQGPETARLWAPPSLPQIGGPWSLADWAPKFGRLNVLAASEVMRLQGRMAPGQVGRIYPQIAARAMGRVIAAGMPRRPGLGPLPEAPAKVVDQRIPYVNFFAIEEYDLAFPRFDGSHSPVVTRAVFAATDAALILPYDPVRDRVLLVEQFRAGPFGRQDKDLWVIETIAGRVDAGEAPEDAARREAQEEAGLTVARLETIGTGYPSPGASTEFYHMYLGLTDLPDSAAGMGGLDTEEEDIRSRVMSFDEAIALCDADGIAAVPTVLMLNWLARHRDRLRAAA
ncbi:NUDIX domain-containing protein [Mesobacterium pallidum]|uniref:NUDIX domain-containing protein n=1 Tax=Mesobacterium pallidum TaxID=2872037 RepID=UPI001EE34506|nr:NUDIX domain-containing protein [Mesobacterium pallidum]